MVALKKPFALTFIAAILAATVFFACSDAKKDDNYYHSFTLLMDKLFEGRANWSDSGHLTSGNTLTVTGFKGTLPLSQFPRELEGLWGNDPASTNALTKALSAPIEIAEITVTDILELEEMSQIMGKPNWTGQEDKQIFGNFTLKGLRQTITFDDNDSMLIRLEEASLEGLTLKALTGEIIEGSAGFIDKIYVKNASHKDFSIESRFDFSSELETLEINFSIASSETRDLSFAGPVGQDKTLLNILLQETASYAKTEGLKFFVSTNNNSLTMTMASYESTGVKGIGNSESSTILDYVIDITIKDDEIPDIHLALAQASTKGLNLTPAIDLYKEAMNVFQERGDPEVFSELVTYASIFVYPYDLDSVTAKGVELKLGNGWSSKMDLFDFQGPIKARKLSSSTTKASGVTFDFTTEMNWPYYENTVAILDFLGMTNVTIDVDLQTQYSPEDDTTTYIVHDLSFRDYVKISGNLTFSGLNQQLIDALNTFPLNSNNPTYLMLFVPQVAALGIADYNLTIENQSLFAKVLDIYARDQGGTPDKYVGLLKELFSTAKESFSEDMSHINPLVYDTLVAFIDDPRKLSFKMTPDFPLSFETVLPYMDSNRKQVELLLSTRFSVSANDGEYVPVFQ
ncbi:MAG: hypothetical protein LBE38_03000 [Deltaproteobacteria bacterium]|jgi:hypothetical protein|nr:hypothetical protein [Deltaproteobacteria bacterium]